MKRVGYRQKYPYLYRVFPLFFFRECSKCGMEFKWELGWSDLTKPWVAMVDGGCNRGTWTYLCRKCAPTKKQAHKYFIEYEEHSNYVRPPAPPIPPPDE